MDELKPPKRIDPKWQAAFVRFVETGEADDEFLEYLNSDPGAQAAVEEAFSRQAAALQELAGAMAATLGTHAGSGESRTARIASVTRVSTYLTPAALLACVLLGAATVRFSGMAAQTQRQLAAAEVARFEMSQQADAYKTALASLQADLLKPRTEAGTHVMGEPQLAENLSQNNARLAKELKGRDDELKQRTQELESMQGRLASAERELIDVNAARVADRSRLTANEAELDSTKLRLASAEKELKEAAAARPNQVRAARMAKTFDDASAIDWMKMTDQQYAATWDKQAAVADFKISADGKVIDSKIVKKSQRIDSNALMLQSPHWITGTVTGFDGKRLPTKVTCIVLPDDSSSAPPKK